MGSTLDKLANIGLFAAAVAVFAWVAPQAVERWRGNGGPIHESVYKRGDLVQGLDDLSIGTASKALILYVRSDCHFCTESMDFYKRLAASEAHRNGQFRIIAISMEPSATTNEYLGRQRLAVEDVVRVDPRAVGLRGTPTLFVVDTQFRVLGVWLGRQRPNGELEIERELGIASPS